MRTKPVLFAILVCAALPACDRNDTASSTELTAAAYETRPSDDELIRRVESAISARPELTQDVRNAEVDSINGVILLRGSVPDIGTKREIERIAEDVPGIKTTLNKLDIRDATQAEADETTAFSIQRAFITDPTIRHEVEQVTIEVDNGTVTLRGRVSSPETRLAVERAVLRTPGVVTVSNTLKTP